MTLSLACLQFSPDKGCVEENIRRMGEMALQASKEGADLALLPELATSGYDVQDGAFECSLTPDELLSQFGNATKGLRKPLDLAVGFYEKASGKPFNSLAYLSLGGESPAVCHVYRKFFPPTYGIFDEGRYQRAGDQLGIVDTRFGKIGLLICEDVWHSVLGSLLALSECRLVLVSAGSPARGFSGQSPGNVLRYEQMLKNLCMEQGMFAAISMLTGFEGGKGMAGGSMILDPTGFKMAQADVLGDEIVTAKIDLALVDVTRNQIPLLQDLRSRWRDLIALADQVVDS